MSALLEDIAALVIERNALRKRVTDLLEANNAQVEEKRAARRRLRTSEALLWDAAELIRTFSKVHGVLTDDDRARLQRFLNTLKNTKGE